MAFVPVVLFPLTLPALLNYVLSTQPSPTRTTLLVCSGREAFLQSLLHALQPQEGQEADELRHWTAPTLRNLSALRNVNIAFCASVQALLAHLASCGHRAANHGEERGGETWVLVNPLGLHAPTASFSAQGLSRTFAAAAEAALRLRAQLVVVECVGTWRDHQYHEEDEEIDAVMGNGGEEARANDGEDPWEREVPILNVSARRFGSGSGERAWAGRTVKINRIAARWFRFHQLDHGVGGTEGPEQSEVDATVVR